MPVDNRRLPVPIDTKPPCMFVKERQVISLLTESGQRHSGRANDQTRPIFANVGVVSQARGSAYIEIGKTKVLAAVYGPREVKFRDEFSLIGQLVCEVKFATFSSQLRHSHQQSEADKEASLIVQEALMPAIRLDKFPKARIDVFLMILEDDGCAMSTAISCASLALSNAAVEMFDLVVGSTIRQHCDIRMVDPDSTEEYKSQKFEAASEMLLNSGCVTVALLPSLNQISSVVQSGRLDVDNAKLCIKQCIQVSQQIYPVLKQCLLAALDKQHS